MDEMMMMEVDCYPEEADRLVHDYWTKPTENWLEYFMSNGKLLELLENAQENKELLGRLATQFAEQACNTEAEERALQSKSFPLEDVQYYGRKSACLWLCSMTCFAAIQWDYLYLLENYDFLTVRPVVEYAKRMFNDTELTTDPTFGNWLWDKFCVTVAIRHRVATPFPKPTVNNPLIKSSPDLQILRYEANQRAIMDLQIYTTRWVQSMETYVKEGKTIYVPGWRCFYTPFKEGAAKALNVGIVGQDVLVAGAPRPQLALQVDLLAAEDVANRARFDLAVFYFDDDCQIKICYGFVQQVTPSSATHPLISIDQKQVDGYRIALGITRLPVTRHTDKNLIDDSTAHRRFGIKRKQQQLLPEPDEGRVIAISMSNLACDVVEQQPVLIRQKIIHNEAFVTFVHQRMSRCKSLLEKRRVYALLHYFCITISEFKPMLEKLGFPKDWITEMVSPPAKAAPTPWQKNIVQALVTGSSPSPFWTMISSFNPDEVVQAVEALQRTNIPLRIPPRFRYPEVLSEFLGNSQRNVIELNAILLGKAQQIVSLNNFVEWDAFAGRLPHILGATQVDKWTMALALEATNVRNYYYNHKLHNIWESFDAQQFTRQSATLKRLFNQPNQQCIGWPNFTKQALAFLLNTKDFDHLVKLELVHPLITAAKLLAAFGTRGGHMDASMTEFLAVWFKHLKPMFENKGANRRDRDQREYREAQKNRTEFIIFIKMIKEPSLLLFLISFFAHLFNCILATDRKPHMKLFVQQSALFPPDFDLIQPHAEAISECLMALLESGLETNPCNAFWIRTAADYRYVRGDMEEAATLYLEVVLACAPSCQQPFPDNVIDDMLWNRLRICLNRLGMNTLAMLVCQLIRKGRTDEYGKTATILVTQPTLDSGSECLSMLYDVALAEELTQVYERSNQHNHLVRLQMWMAKSSMNGNNRADVISREQSRRCELLLRTLAANLFATHLL